MDPEEDPTNGPKNGPNDNPSEVPAGVPANAAIEDSANAAVEGSGKGPAEGPAEGPTEGPTECQTDNPGVAPANDPNQGSNDDSLDITARILADSNRRRAAINNKKYLAQLRSKLQQQNQNQAPLLPIQPSTVVNPPPGPSGEIQPPLPPVQPVTAVNPPSEALDHPMEWSEEELARAQEEYSSFEEIQNWYNALDEPTLEDIVTYEGAKNEESIRQKRLTSKKFIEVEDEPEDQQQAALSDDDELFCRQDEPANVPNNQDPPGGNNQLTEEERLVSLLTDSTSHPNDQEPPGGNNLAEASVQEPAKPPQKPKPASNKRKRVNRISAQEKRKSMGYGLEAARSKVKKDAAKASRKRKANALPGDEDVSGAGQQRKKKKVTRKAGKRNKGKLDFAGLFVADIITQGHANSSRPAIPTMTGKNKEKALTELVASIPTSDRVEAKSDRKLVLEATRKFTNLVRADGNGGWKIKGMQTSLYHYQLLGAGFMRDRENSGAAPYGGMLCDVMGFGKTIQALANIVDGCLHEPNDPVKTTLIVVPPHLVSHWKKQIQRHCDRDTIGAVLDYHAGSRLSTLDMEQTVQKIQDFDFVITTYEEIRRSYPVLRNPAPTMDDAQIEAQWDETCRGSLGPLHRIKFRRILLDEGHIIKNHLSKTSVAVRALTGHYKWVISGTPLHNAAQEFYPYLDFLGVPHTGSFGDFLQNYISEERSQERLKNIVRSILFRRTHASRMFSMPVIKLPDIGERTVEATFCDVEQVIYNRIFTIFVENLNGMPENEKLAKYRCFLTMILRLRMFSSHILTIQGMLKPLLTDDIMRHLSTISNHETNPERPSLKITQWLKAMKKQFTMPAKSAEPVQDNRENREADTAPPAQVFHGDDKELVQKFHEFMSQLHENGQWTERLTRTNCPSCGMFPEVAIITSCKHLYCDECYYRLREDDQAGTGNPVCQNCNVEITEAANCGSIDDFQSAASTATASTTPKQPANKRKKKTRKTNNTMLKFGMFTSTDILPVQKTSDAAAEEIDGDEEMDWITNAAQEMPGAKLDKVREVIASWIENDQETKVVVFTQFIDFVRILGAMCKKEKWGYTCLTGKMLNRARDLNMQNFKVNPEVRVLIASLKAGGTGLDMSMANKCILVDPWWNEAVEEQAMGRLYRIGQKRNVEFVKIVVRGTIDDYLLEVQNRKSVEIDDTIGKEALEQRETIAKLLELFGAVQEGQERGFILMPRRKEQQEEREVAELD